MAHRIYSEHNYHIVRKCEDETNEEDENRVMAATSTTTVEAVGSHSGGSIVCVCGQNDDGESENESDSEDSDDDFSESSSDSDSSSSSSESSGPEEPSSSVPDEAQIPRHYSHGYRQTPFRFTQWQVEEMESLFEETQYPDMLTMEELARVLNVPEIKVKVWFVNRRAKQRKNERAARL